MDKSKIKEKGSKINEQSEHRVAIVHDWLYGGGAEKVVEQLHILYPDAPIYTSYCSDEWRKQLDNKVVTGYLQKWPFNKLRRFLPILQMFWFRSLDLSSYDIVISSSGSGFAKHLKFKKTSNLKSQISNMKRPLHVSYCHTPPHYLWAKYDEYMKRPGFGIFDPLVRLGLKLLFKPLRKADYKAAQNVDRFIANSTHIKNDIKKFYKRDADVVFPPVDTEAFHTKPVSERSGFIVYGRHVAHKRFDLAIKACNELQAPLTVVGSGPETPRLKALAGPTVTFTGRLEHDKLVRALAKSAFFIFPNVEDFGIVAVEAQAAGVPVIAYRGGGALDSVVEGVTGEFFDAQTIDSLVTALKKANYKLYNHRALLENAECFSIDTFQRSMTQAIADTLNSK